MVVILPVVLEKVRKYSPDLSEIHLKQVLSVGAATLDRMARSWKVQRGLFVHERA
jgi:hypothetical protein